MNTQIDLHQTSNAHASIFDGQHTSFAKYAAAWLDKALGQRRDREKGFKALTAVTDHKSEAPITLRCVDSIRPQAGLVKTHLLLRGIKTRVLQPQRFRKSKKRACHCRQVK